MQTQWRSAGAGAYGLDYNVLPMLFRIYKIDDEELKEDQYRKGWMVKCVQFFTQYYGIAPVEVIYEMYKLKIKCSIDEMVEMLTQLGFYAGWPKAWAAFRMPKEVYEEK